MTMRPVPQRDLGSLMGDLDPSEREFVLKETARIGAEKIKVMRDALRDAYGFVKPPPAERITSYRLRAAEPQPNRWDFLRHYLPRVEHEQMMDWRQLEERYESDADFAARADQALAMRVAKAQIEAMRNPATSALPGGQAPLVAEQAAEESPPPQASAAASAQPPPPPMPPPPGSPPAPSFTPPPRPALAA